MLTFHNILTENEKNEICNWKYDGKYAIYNLKPQTELINNKEGIYNPDNAENYYAFYENDLFVGYINMVERNNKFSIGIAVKPELCSKGYGRQMLTICSEIAGNITPGKPLGLQVRTWNKRAVRCYKKAGFVPDGQPYILTTPSGEGEFVRMVKR